MKSELKLQSKFKAKDKTQVNSLSVKTSTTIRPSNEQVY